MIFITTYKVKPYLSKKKTTELMTLFAEQGEGPGTTAHYVAVDGSHGIVISETDNAEDGYKSILPYTPYIEYDTKVYLTVEQAVPHILQALA